MTLPWNHLEDLLTLNAPKWSFFLSESDALKGEFYQEWARTNKKHKIQRLFQTISDDNHRASLIRLRGKLCDINHKIVVKSLQNSPEGSCLLSRLFTTPLSFRDSRLNKTQFILACRQFLSWLERAGGNSKSLSCPRRAALWVDRWSRRMSKNVIHNCLLR